MVLCQPRKSASAHRVCDEVAAGRAGDDALGRITSTDYQSFSERLPPSEPLKWVSRMEDERRLVGRVLGHWTKTVHARGFPRHDEIDPWMLGDDWANCLLIAVEEPVELSHFVSVGKNLAVALYCGTSLVGVFMSHLPRVLSERRCLIAEGGATLRGMRILYRSALLPLSEDGATISHVLGAASYRPLAADEARSGEVTETRWV